MNTPNTITFLGMTMERRTRWNFLCDGSNAALVGIYIGIVGPFTLPLAIRLGADAMMVGLITAAPFIANLLAPLWASLSSQSSRKVPWVVIPHIIWRAGMGLVGLLKNPAAITALFVGTNVAVAAANPAYGALVQKVFPGPIRGRLMGYVRIGLAGVMLPTTLMAGQLLDRYGPAILYLVAGLAGLLGISLFALIKEGDGAATSGPSAPKVGPVEGLRLAFADPVFRRFLIATVIFHGGVLVAQPLYSQYQVKEMLLTNAQISYLAVAWNLAWLGAFAFWGRVIDRKGPGPVVIGAAAFYLGLPLAYGLGGGIFALAVLGAMCQGIADAAMDLGGWNMILNANPERVGAYTSAAMLATGIRGAIGPLAGSFLLSAVGFQWTFLAAAAMVAGGLVIFLSGRRHVAPGI